MSRLKYLLLLFALAAQVPLASATVTYVVGTCKPSFPLSSIFTHINDALKATPPPNVVEVCPGTYAEQVVISRPVTIEGISDGSSSGATITVPSGGLASTASDDLGDGFLLAPQVWVDNVSGEVNLTNFTVVVTYNSVFDIGVFYQNSPGTMNHLTIQNPSANGLGFGVWLEGGSANPSVTLENSNLQGLLVGIFAETNSSTSELTATIKGNYMSPAPSSTFGSTIGISLGSDLENAAPGATADMSGNLITGGDIGIAITGAEGSASKNTIVGAQAFGIADGVIGPNGLFANSVAVTSNTIYNIGPNGGDLPGGEGMILFTSSVPPVTGNTIVAAGIGIDLECTAGNNVHSNTILGTGDGLLNVPSGALTTNTYYNVGTLRSSNIVGGCR